MALLCRHIFESDGSKVLLSLDGIGAYDHISRQSILAKLAELLEACEMLSFVRLFYGEQSIFLWHDEKGRQHQIFQGEGGEQEEDEEG